MTYNEYISQFEILENPPIKKGFHRHHIVPKSQQIEVDERQVYMTLPQHMWAHILYDRENGTKTSIRFLNMCGKPESFFTRYEDCLAYSSLLREKMVERERKILESMKLPSVKQKMSKAQKGNQNSRGPHKSVSDDTKRKLSDSLKGKNTWTQGRHFYNNGEKEVLATECPEGFVKGRLSSVMTRIGEKHRKVK